MNRTFLAAAAVGMFTLSAVAFSGNAQAQCYWTGIDWACPTARGYSYPYVGPHGRALQFIPFSDRYYPGPPLTGSGS